MTTTTAVMALLGAGVGLGVLLIVAGWRGTSLRLPIRARRRPDQAERDPIRVRWLLAAGAAGIVVAIATGWLVGGVLAAMATWGLPRVLGSDKHHARAVARIEAVASWSEMLRDTLAAAAGLEQAIVATAERVPDAIRPEINELTFRLERGDRLAPSLRHLADQLADPTADLLISALVLASEKQARQLADLLGELATETREQVSMRLRVEAGRARTRTSVRMIVGVTVAFAAGLNRGYLAPFDGVLGQLMLALVGGLFTISFLWLARMARYQTPDRFLTDLGALRARDAGAYQPVEGAKG
ncbi:type II secretion system F family protein [Amycolatopsis sp. H20-H5]|uniref:type II secretion system F family protein n=1 Tax=Amycolatopsis sp. H20-H5 TaxID=3046309 RepID=UPI002DB93ED0|nr:type II secretion system F family protein [Amycolatopsis sp. H20-H5]MEC3974318.1 type II secretion system F family protein [Amycolatopsis sp. H20-H5]